MEQLRAGRSDLAAARLGREAGDDATLQRLLGMALKAEQDVLAADAALARARALAPRDPLAAFLHAQSRFELGHPAADLFAAARALWPDNPDVLRNHALALAAEGAPDEGIALLAVATAARPDWLDGQRVLASLRWTHGRPDPFAGHAAAARAHPRGLRLWQAWFAALAQQRDWDAARAVIAEARAASGDPDALLAAETFVACESGDAVAARALLARTAASDDPGLRLCRLRFALREGAPDRARDEGLALLASPAAAQAWPYLSLAWRMLGDARADWLDGAPPYVGVYDVDLSPAELAALADTLRGLHVARAPYGEQSVRGGTQTDRSLLLRHEPILQRARAALMAAVERHVAGLPPPDPRHPLLGRPLARLRIAGSWSVRLTDGGHNVAHTHPMGWLSSAFYVALPPPADGDAGHLALGAPPPELGLDLAPFRTVAPAVGRLVLFPSTMWHATVPFAAGERLNIAFDVVPG